MTGHLLNEDINSILWTDSEINKISIDYDAIHISFSESTGAEKFIKCEGYIGYKVVGFWDEMIIASGRIENDHSFIQECLDAIDSRYQGRPPITGNAIRNKKNWGLLRILLIDNTEIMIACGKIYTGTMRRST